MERTSTSTYKVEWEGFRKKRVFNPYSLQAIGRIKTNGEFMFNEIDCLPIPTVLKKECKQHYLLDNLYCNEYKPCRFQEISLTYFKEAGQICEPDLILSAFWEELPFIEEENEAFWFFNVYSCYNPEGLDDTRYKICQKCYEQIRLLPKEDYEKEFNFQWEHTRMCFYKKVHEIKEDLSMSDKWCYRCKRGTLFFIQPLQWWELEQLEDSDE